jgi:hypothetical protein
LHGGERVGREDGRQPFPCHGCGCVVVSGRSSVRCRVDLVCARRTGCMVVYGYRMIAR